MVGLQKLSLSVPSAAVVSYHNE